jgi:hypothetical protein
MPETSLLGKATSLLGKASEQRHRIDECVTSVTVRYFGLPAEIIFRRLRRGAREARTT